MYVYIYIYSIVFFFDICMPLLESMSLSVVIFFPNPSQNWTFQRFARVARERKNATEQIKNMTLATI